MSNNPTVSVLIPVYNAEKYIKEALDSILNQTFKNFELIIINDCSTDSTEKIIKRYAKKDSRILLVNNKENLKISKTLNKGIGIAKGKYIVRMDADDWSYPDRIEKQVGYMESNPDIVLSSGNMEICDEKMIIKNRSNFPTTDHNIREVLLQYNPMVHPAMIFRRDIALSIGGYNETVKSEDYMFIIDMSSKGKLGNLKDILIKYRILGNSHTGNKMQSVHLSTLSCAFIAHIKYGYPITLKTKLIHLFRLFIAYFIPSSVWRFISSILRK